jgi:hypothetical protein
MRWRARAGIAFAVLGFLTLGSQPVARWIVSTAISRFVSGEVTIDGTVRWDPLKHAWSCGQFQFESANGQTWRAERMTVRMDPKEFLRRNLVVDSAHVEGITMRADSVQPATPDEADVLRALPSFSIDTWIESELNRQKSKILSAVQSREYHKRDLQQRLDQLRERCDSTLAPSESNPMRSRQVANEVQREIASLLQAMAEERIRIRELDSNLQHRAVHWTIAWQDELSNSISQSIPNPSASAHLVVKKCIKEHWDSFRAILSVASVSTQSLGEAVSETRGTDVPIPGLPRNYALIRTASLTGQLETDLGSKMPFRAKLVGMGDANVPANPKSEWRFERTGIEPSGAESGKAIIVNVQTSSGLQFPWLAPTRGSQELTWIDPALPYAASKSASESASHLRWTRGEKGDNMEVAFPVGILIQPQSSTWSEWQSYWDQVVKEHHCERLVASWWTEAGSMEQSADPWQCSGLELDPETGALAEEIWEETRARYVDGVTQRLQPRISGLISGMGPFLDETWSAGLQQHLDGLADMERDANWLRTRWNARER